MLLLPDDGLGERRAAAGGGLAPLADALAAELEPLLGRELLLPAEKARLTRAGGYCPRDGAPLEFDPWSRDAHRCSRCGTVVRGDEHYRIWVMYYQLWLAERAVHAALLHLLRGDVRHAALAQDILSRYADGYLSYPNRDNVLGPTRLFFSTYLESIWLLQLCVALDLLEASGVAGPLSGAVRDRVLAPAAALIASYGEGASNRQVWHNAALLASARLLGADAAAQYTIAGPAGIVRHLAAGLLADGSWYEGENYHLFAHRGLWYGVTLAEVAGYDFPESLRQRFDAGFAIPFLTALPDLTLPSRKDSKYATSLRQWRFAELCELGLARAEDARLRGALAELYDPSVVGRDTGRSRSTADVEQNMPASGLTRADLGWRSLLRARPELPPLERLSPRSALLEGQGVAIFRRDGGQLYTMLDYGHSGGGHGHPDRLNLVLMDGATRWLDDVGTGSYVSRSLHWYRSTLAHNAPLVNGRSQESVDGTLTMYEERGGVGWASADAEIAPRVRLSRSVVAMPDYVVEQLTWSSPQPVQVDLPLHVDGQLQGITDWERAPLPGGEGLEDGFEFLEQTACATPAENPVRLEARQGDASLAVWVVSTSNAQWWRATAPGPPGCGPRRFHLARMRGTQGSMTTLWSPRASVRAVMTRDNTLIVELRDGTRHEHGRTPDGWHIEMLAGAARSSVDLAGPRRPGARVTLESAAITEMPEDIVIPVPARAAGPAGNGTGPRWLVDASAAERAQFAIRALGEANYRRSEQSWREAGAPAADVGLTVQNGALVVEADVRKADVVLAPGGRANLLDNEHPDVNVDGLELHLLAPTGDAGALEYAGWLLAPEPGSARVRVHRVAGSAAPIHLAAEWRATANGWAMRCELPLADLLPSGARELFVDVIVNETARDRERRRGQLVLSGGRGEFVYLRGDRQDAERILTRRVRLTDG